MRISGDPLADFSRHDAECERGLSKLPRCCECGEPIQDEIYYDFHDKYICDTCMTENHRRFTDDYE